MSTSIQNLQAFTNALDRKKKAMHGKVTSKYKRFVSRVLEDLALNTPQWSGDLAASWQVVVGSGSAPTARYKADSSGSTQSRSSAYKMGDRPSVDFSISNNESAINSIRWNSIVSIVNTNPTSRFQAANAARADAGEHPGMRDENRPKIAGDFMGVQYVKQKWSTANRNLGFSR